MKRHSLFTFLTVMAALLVLASAVAAAPCFNVVQTGPSSFDVRVNNLTNTAGMDFTIKYDTAYYQSPRASWVGPAKGTSQVNPAFLPGVIRMVIMNTTPFAGPNGSAVAHIDFTPMNAAGGPKPTLQAALYSPTAERIAASVAEVCPVESDQADTASVLNGESASPGSTDIAGNPSTNPSGSTSDDTSSSSTATTTGNSSGNTPGTQTVTGQRTVTGQGTTSTSASSAYLGSVTFSDSPSAKTETATAETPQHSASDTSFSSGSSGSSYSDSTETQVEKTKPYEPPKGPDRFVSHQAVLQKFKEFKGEPTVKNLTELFQSPSPVGFSQKPQIILADGSAQATITIPAKADEKVTPQFALKGGSQLSLKKTPQGWVMDVKLKKNVLDAAVTVISGPVITEYPLLVAPPVETKAKKITEGDFEAFLKDRGTPRLPRHDLNTDGKRNYIDDYIYTANYLSLNDGKATAAPGEKKAANAEAGKDVKAVGAAVAEKPAAKEADQKVEKGKEKKSKKSKAKK